MRGAVESATAASRPGCYPSEVPPRERSVALLRGAGIHGVHPAFIDGLERGFRLRGLRTTRIDLADAATVPAGVERFLDSPPSFSVGIAPTTVRIGGRPLHEVAGIPHLAIMVDHPSHPISHYEAPAHEALRFSVVDPGHVDFLRRLGVDRAFFLPHGGDSRFAFAEAAPRDIPLLFTGGAASSAETEATLLREVPPALAAPVREIIASFRRDPSLLPEAAARGAVEAAADAAGADPLRLEVFLAGRLELVFRTVKREAILGALRDRALWFAGDPGPSIEPGPRWRMLGPLPFDETIALHRRARAVLHVHSTFPGGSHERIPNALLAGAAVVSERTGWIDRAFAGCRGAFGLYDPAAPDGVAAAAESAAAAPDDVRAAARDLVLRSHTWERRADRILSAMA